MLPVPGHVSAAVGSRDSDGDGIPAPEGCDDHDPDAWEAAGVYTGDLSGDFTSFYEGYCARSTTGSVDLSAASASDVA